MQELILTDEEKELIIRTRKNAIKNKWMDKEEELDIFPDQEKIEWFNSVYLDAFKILEEHMYSDERKDVEHWCFERMMEILGEDIWEYWNQVD